MVNKTLPTLESAPADVTVDTHGTVWFTEGRSGCVLRRVSSTGHLTERPWIGGGDCGVLTVGPDGNAGLRSTPMQLRFTIVK